MTSKHTATETKRIDIQPPGLDDPAETATEIESFITAAVRDADRDGVVVNLSGGIDSTVTAILATRALGPECVYGLVLPAESTPETDVADAQDLAHDLGIDFRTIDIEPLLTTFTRTVATKQHTIAWPDPLSTSNPQTVLFDPVQTRDHYRESLGNTAARMRMVTAYFEANTTNRLVLGTGNRTEHLLGYFTKYGDGDVDLLPIGDLYKSEVRDLARHLGVDEHVIEKPPSAGLWPGQLDEDELGASYDIVDAVLHRLIDNDQSLETVANELDLEKALVDRLARMYRDASHKRTPPPTPFSPSNRD